ncbi:hypothetical protein MMG00_04270 [Ignatzschineria rhizosphaerae]|uniref:Mechanosensitive ion channel n=1 Tax=Ignatzschineria rhizosphaerae TaxID=2923279 RepID=A0ABY3X599_9GAMM|nr:hypothetical protein [Ignatzschineria rhizosphaerae]UNM97075.1 hypothetical protein MMG00_04270 [Ignatzschineria rhizosphaerae]
MFNKKIAFGTLISAFLILLATTFAAANTINNPSPSIECCDVLESTENSIEDIQSKIAALKIELNDAVTAETKSEIEDRINQLQARLTQSRTEFEKYALGGVDINFLTKTGNEEELNYDWQAELLQIVQPVFSEIQRLTKATREKEDINRELTLTKEKIATLEKGLAYLNTIPKESLSPTLTKKLETINNNWSSFLKDLVRDRDHYQNLLDAMTTDETFLQSLKNGIVDFLKGRGLILLVSFATFFAVLYILTKGMDFILQRRHNRQKGQQKVNLRARLLLLIYRIISVITSVVAFLIVVHSMGDMVLFGIAILILLALIFAFRNYVPKYFSEIRLFLNLGSARQGERVIYRGVPWIIERITLYTATLYNPSLDNGRIRLMLPELETLTSRPFNNDEIWFPAKVGDSFILPNGTFGEVKRQTPESVYLNSFNSTIIYPTADFIAGAPTNLSYGYYAVADFGLSYKHFDTPVDEIFSKLKAYITEFLSNTALHDQYNSLSVEFRKINEGMSLVYTVIVAMKGSSAAYYFQSGRLLQEACLRCAQKEGWSMPFTNIEMRDNQNQVITGKN